MSGIEKGEVAAVFAHGGDQRCRDQGPVKADGRLVTAPTLACQWILSMSADSRIPTDAEVNDHRQLLLLTEATAEQRAEEIWARHLTPEALARAEKSEREEQEAKAKEKRPKLGKLIRLPAKKPEDQVLRLEQNLGCEMPVCVGNRRDVNKVAIEVPVDETTVWRLVRTADTSLPAPEHYPLWLWFLDRCQAAAKAGCTTPPRIPINLAEMQALFGRKGNMGGKWYNNIDDAFWRFSHLVVEIQRGNPKPGKRRAVEAVLGTLCYYASWREEGTEGREFERGWVAPGQMLWESILAGYIKAVPMQIMRGLPSYVAQRLMTYLAKHCRPGETFKISLTKLLPKIPLDCPNNEAKKRLRTHHKVLLDTRFLVSIPIFEGRGSSTMVTYARAPEPLLLA